MKSLETRLIAGIISVSILLIVTGAVLYSALNESNEKAAQVEHANEVLTELEATLSILKDGETGQRGYIITGQESYLEPFREADQHAGEKMARLKMLTETSESHQAKLAAAEPLIESKFALMRRTIDLRRNSGFEAAQRVVQTNQGKNTMDAIRKLFAAMKDEEIKTLQNFKTLSEVKTRNVIFAFGALILLILFLFCLVYFLVKKDIAERNLLTDKLRELATTDELTGICNRREANRLLKKETMRFRRYGNPVAVLLLDIDYFKSVNDTYGHQIGDEVLKWVAAKLGDSVRTVDTAARYGGEEFIVILPQTDRADAFVIAERARQNIAEKPFIFEQESGQTINIPVTASIGVATAENACSEEEIVEAADEALYRAKHAGRNRVVMSGETIQVPKTSQMQAVA